MTDRTTIIKEPPQSKKGIFGTTAEFILKIFGVLFFSMLVSVLIEWCGMYFFYPDAGYQHAEALLQQELGHLRGSASGDEYNDKHINTATQEVGSLINTLFVKSGVMASVEDLRNQKPNDGKIVATARAVVAQGYDYIMAAIFIVSMFLVRLTILVLSLPVFVLFGVVGLSDGLMQRDLRRWCGGNESGYVYHWSKKLAMPVLMIAWFTYLAIPDSIHPNFIILPFAVLFGLVLMVMSSKFKKYL